jgi:hypothetical protein
LERKKKGPSEERRGKKEEKLRERERKKKEETEKTMEQRKKISFPDSFVLLFRLSLRGSARSPLYDPSRRPCRPSRIFWIWMDGTTGREKRALDGWMDDNPAKSAIKT